MPFLPARPRPTRCPARAALVLLAAAAAASPAPAFAKEKTVVVSREIQVTIGDGDEIVLSARPLPGEGIDAFVRRLTDDPATKKEILASNRNLGKRLKPDTVVRVPYRLLSGAFRKIAIEALFPDDKATAEGWEHKAAARRGTPGAVGRVWGCFTGAAGK